MSLQVLVSTMNQKNTELIKKMKIDSDSIVINQGCSSNVELLKKNEYQIKWVNSTGQGLSKSRNEAIFKATGDICLLADDDLIYIDKYSEIIYEQFQKYPKVDIIVFQVEGIEKKFKKYNRKSRRLNYITSMKVSSVEVAFRLKSIKEKNIQFDELFGSGSKYFMGEENIFLFDCLRKKLKIRYVPIKIADLHIGESSWFKGYDIDYFISKGAVFTRLSKTLSTILIIQFAIRKHKLYSDDITFINSIKYMFKGRKKYLINSVS